MSAYYGETSDAAREVASQTKYHPKGGAMLGGMAGSMPDAPERDLRFIITRIRDAIASAEQAAARIHGVADRVKGSIPEAKNGCGLASGGAGDIGEIHSLLDTLSNLHSATADGINRLESL